MRRHSILALLVVGPLAMAAAAAPVEGPDSLDVKSMAIQYDAAQIRDHKSAAKLFFRIRLAAEEVCRLASFPRGYEMWDEHACEVGAVDEAVRNADLPALDRYYYRGTPPDPLTRR